MNVIRVAWWVYACIIWLNVSLNTWAALDKGDLLSRAAATMACVIVVMLCFDKAIEAIRRARDA